jgi:tight adherence protein B
MSGVVWASIACIFLAAGVGLWSYAERQQHVQRIEQRVLDAEQSSAAMPEVRMDGPLMQAHPLWTFAPAWLQQAFGSKQWLWIILPTVVVTFIVIIMTHSPIALIVPVVVFAIVVFVAWLKWQRLRARVVQQLPSFIDGMVRMVVLGHATQAAFVMAAAGAKEPLAQRVNQAAVFSKAGMPIDQALNVATRDLKLQEFSLLASVIQVGSQFGGRVDHLLERVAHLMRDRDQANQELRALSAEVRVSAWVLSLLPLVVGGMIIVINAAYFMKMWDDPSGRWLALFGLGLQATGTIILYRMARLDEQ